jgi:hypothetical protein
VMRRLFNITHLMIKSRDPNLYSLSAVSPPGMKLNISTPYASTNRLVTTKFRMHVRTCIPLN